MENKNNEFGKLQVDDEDLVSSGSEDDVMGSGYDETVPHGNPGITVSTYYRHYYFYYIFGENGLSSQFLVFYELKKIISFVKI